MRSWVVGGALILSDEGVLLVQNRRRNGSHDWTPPGGVIDEDLFDYDVVWAAAGTPWDVFAVTAADLVQLTGGTVAPLRAT